ncbi:MAG: glycoside hydrolase family 3 C-terminal domain-containing protein [Clostridia bacterium]|nr:glycoside hydrolase family 3 C-terminal domain-containing protein [Clostridia bacterium]
MRLTIKKVCAGLCVAVFMATMLSTTAYAGAVDSGTYSQIFSSGTVSRKGDYSKAEYESAALAAAEEGAVLLKNENAALPLKTTDHVAVFGSRQFYGKPTDKDPSYEIWSYIPGGAGSGAVWGNIGTSPYEQIKAKADAGKFKLYTTISENYKSKKSSYTPSDKDLNAAKKAGVNKAVYIISRYEGENGDEDGMADNADAPGNWRLSTKEKLLLTKLNATFGQVIVVTNTGILMDTNWIKNGIDGTQVVDAALFAWYGGHQGPKAIANLLTGDATPSGKLAQTAAPIENYPTTEGFFEQAYTNYSEDIFMGYRYFETFNKAVNYEFGFGLSYTTFSMSDVKYSSNNTHITVSAKVTNTGNASGKEVLQVYFSAPQGKLGKPAKELAGFAKTDTLKPGQAQTLTIKFPINDMSSYDDTGKTGKKSAWVLEAGDYNVYIGNSVKNVQKAGTYKVSSLKVVEQCTAQAGPLDLTKRLLANGQYETLTTGTKQTPVDYAKNNALATKANGTVKFADVVSGKNTLDQLVAQMSIEELGAFTHLTVTSGAAQGSGVGAGAASDKYGIPIGKTLDGPAGPDTSQFSFPSETCLASSWNLDHAANLGTIAGKYCKKLGSTFWLAPALNLQRNPLGGRNFEYYSEDPLISGLFCATSTANAQAQGAVVALKHLAANNKETNRGGNDSRMSERCLRELYLKGFEIAIKTVNPGSIMTGYNRLNGYDLNAIQPLQINLLRKEWGWDGMFMTDWDDLGDAGDTVSALLSGTNIRMGKPENNKSAEKVIAAYGNGTVSRQLLEANAKYVLQALVRTQKPISYTWVKDTTRSAISNSGNSSGGTSSTTTGNNGGNSGNSGNADNGTTAGGNIAVTNPDGSNVTNADGSTVTEPSTNVTNDGGNTGNDNVGGNDGNSDNDPQDPNAGANTDPNGPNLSWLWIVLAVVVCAGAGVAVFFILKKRKTTETTEQ